MSRRIRSLLAVSSPDEVPSATPLFLRRALAWSLCFLCVGTRTLPRSVQAADVPPGTKLWEFARGPALFSAPAIGANGTVYLGSDDGKLYALNGASGKTIWEFAGRAGRVSSPALGDDATVYIGSSDFCVYALNAASGAKRWTFATGATVSASPAIGEDGTVYVGSEDHNVYALDGATGAERWVVTVGGAVWCSAAIGRDGTVYVGSEWPDNRLYALNGATGSRRWAFTADQAMRSSPAIGADGAVYVGSLDHKVYAVDGATGAKRWEFATGEGVISSPAIGVDGTVYVGSEDGKVYALDGATGAKRWEFRTGNAVFSSPAISTDGTVYVGSGDWSVYALDATSGALRWVLNTEGTITSSPALGPDGVVYVGPSSKLYAFNGSAPLAQSPWPKFRGDEQNTGASTVPVVAGQPQNAAALLDSPNRVTLEVLARGARPLCFQWFFQAAAIPGATNTALVLTNVGPNRAGSYYVTVSNGLGIATSQVARVVLGYGLTLSTLGGGRIQVEPAYPVYQPGTLVRLTALPEVAGGFEAWRGDAAGQDNPLQLVIDKHTSVIAKFLPRPGEKLWEFTTGGEIDSSPAIGPDGTIYIGSTDHKIYALDGAAGTLRWAFTTDGRVWSSPSVGPDGTVYVGSEDSRVYALEGATGARRWTVATGSIVRGSPAIGADGTVYVGSWDKKVHALDGATGAERWAFTTGAEVFSAPAIGTNGAVYFGGMDSKLYGLDGTTGAKQWEFSTGWLVVSSPAIGLDGTVYVGSYDSKLYALAGGTGAILWAWGTGGHVVSSPAVGPDGTVYVGSEDGKVYALDGTTGANRWACTAGTIDSSPAIAADGTLYVGSLNHSVYALDGATGAKRWEFVTDGGVYSSPAIGADGTVYVGSWDRKVYALKGSAPLARSSWPKFRGNARNTGVPNIAAPPVIRAQAKDRFFMQSQPGLLYVHATGWPVPSFQWFSNSLPILGATNASYVIESVTAKHEGYYTVGLSNELGQVTSQPIRVFVANRDVDRYAGLTLNATSGAASQIEYRPGLGTASGWSVLTNLAWPTVPPICIDFGSKGDAKRFYRATGVNRLAIGLYNAWEWSEPVGTRYQVEYVDAGSGATNWQVLTNLTLTSSPYVFIDYGATNALRRFYRVK